MPPPPGPLLARIGLPTPLARLAALVVVLLVAGMARGGANDVLIATKDAVVRHFDWLFVGVATGALAAVALLAVLPRANTRLGPDDGRPEFSTLSWFAMLFSAGLASGLLYWATAEPILHQQANPFLGDDPEGVRTALRITVLHWGLHGWAFYVLAGLAIAYYSHRRGFPLSFRAAFVPLIGPERLDRWPGRAIDFLAVLGTVCGVATSIGISAGGINATLGSLLGFDVTIPLQVAIVFFVSGLGVVSALTGLDRGIRRLSELNVWLSALFLLAILALGPTLLLGATFVRTLLDYVVHVVPLGLWLAETPEEQAWHGDWTVFYWAWWLAWTPFVSLFIARISKGRTLREFVVAVMLVPTAVVVLWMTVLGGTALHLEAASPGLVSAEVAKDTSLGIVAVIGNLGSPTVATGIIAIAAFLLFTWLITSLDSATLVLCHLLGTEEAPPAKIFWGFALAAVTVVLLHAGGLLALQAASIVIGLPLAVLVAALAVALVRDLASRAD